MTLQEIIRLLLRQFGENVSIRVIAQYTEDEYFIPYNEAVKLIHDAIMFEI